MKTKFPLKLLLCFLTPVITVAQSKQKPFVFHQSQIDKYPGGVYAVWDSSSKQYKWHSPQNNYLSKISASNNTVIKNDDKENNAATSIFHLVKDINTATDGGGYNGQPQFYNQHYAVINGIAYFGADDGIHGAELWRSDGTDAGTYIVKDIEPGAGSSGVSNISVANGMIYFSAVTAANGALPWVSDGTEAGTHILKDISGYTNGGYPEMYTAVKDKVYFFTGRNQLWITDGTEAGTQQIPVSSDNSNFAQPVAVGNKLFFTAVNFSYGRQLWRSNGTEAGTFMVGIIGINYNSGPEQLTAYQNKLYFSGDNGIGRKLYVSDGTEAGTTVVANDNNVLLPYYDGVENNLVDIPFTIIDKTFYFVGFDAYGNTGVELFKYSPENSDGIKLVKDITPGFDGTNIQPFEIAKLNDKVIFKVINADGSATLWKSKGNDADTKPLKTFLTVNGFNFYNLSAPASGMLFFEAYSAANGFELWKSDGTAANTVMVKDIFPGIYSSYPYFYTAFSTGILFSARTQATGYELWKSDGTSAGTQLAKDINQTSSGSSIFTYNITNVPDGVIFSAYDVLDGVEPFYSDGTDGNTKIISDIFHGDFSSYPYAIKTINGNVYFITAYDDNYIPALYKYSLSTKSLVKLFEQPSGYFIQSNYEVADNGLVFFQMFNSNFYQYEIWRTDGTSKGSFMLVGNQYQNLFELVTIGNTAYFPFNDQYYGYELYKSDGTIKGTKIFTDIFPGSAGSNPYDLFAYKGELYFGAYDETYTTSLWKTNGTFFGTKKVAPIIPVFRQSQDNDLSRIYCISNGLLYLNAFDYSTGEQLWVTNGTSAGTKQVKVINPFGSASINHLTSINGLVCFSADDGVHGNELWVSNGTKLGTRLLKDITPGSNGSNIYSFTPAAHKLYFLKDGALWISTGFGDRTNPVNDDALRDVTDINDLIASDNKLFFSGYSYAHGTELYEGDVSIQAVAESQKQANAIAKQENNVLHAIVLPNPVHDNAILQLFNAKNAAVILTDNNGKVVWQKQDINTTQIQISMQQFAAGTYFIKIESGNKTVTLKLIKE